MFAFIVRRLLMLPLVFFGVTLFIVLLMQVLSPFQRAASYAQTEQQARNLGAVIEQYGLNDPWYQQYGRWLGQVANGNLGYSRTSSEPVLTTLRERFPPHCRTRPVLLFSYHWRRHMVRHGGSPEP